MMGSIKKILIDDRAMYARMIRVNKSTATTAVEITHGPDTTMFDVKDTMVLLSIMKSKTYLF